MGGNILWFKSQARFYFLKPSLGTDSIEPGTFERFLSSAQTAILGILARFKFPLMGSFGGWVFVVDVTTGCLEVSPQKFTHLTKIWIPLIAGKNWAFFPGL